MSETKVQIGSYGEDIAMRYLRQQGYFICARNWRCGRYEIDIVAQRQGVTHFVEVRTRKAGSLLKPEETLSPEKESAMRRAAAIYIKEFRIMGDIELDLVAIDLFPDKSYDIRFIHSVAEKHW